MSKYLISFPSSSMVVAPEDFAAVGDAAREVVREAKAAGVYVFAGGIHDGVAPSGPRRRFDDRGDLAPRRWVLRA